MVTDLHSLAHSYVVGALSTDEAQAFERHLVECAECSADVVDIRAVTSALSTTVATTPPPRLRQTVLTRIAETPQEAHQAAPAGSSSSRVEAAVEPPRPTESTVVPLRSGPRRRLATSLLTAAAVVAAIGFGGWAYQASQDADRSQVVADRARDAAAKARDERDRLADVLSADDVRTVSGRFPDTNHTGTVVMSQTRGAAMFVANGLPALPDGKVYEAWTINGQPKAAGTFTPEGEDSVLELPRSTFEASSFAITVEPAGGSPQPTTDPIFAVEMPRA